MNRYILRDLAELNHSFEPNLIKKWFLENIIGAENLHYKIFEIIDKNVIPSLGVDVIAENLIKDLNKQFNGFEFRELWKIRFQKCLLGLKVL